MRSIVRRSALFLLAVVALLAWHAGPASAQTLPTDCWDCESLWGGTVCSGQTSHGLTGCAQFVNNGVPHCVPYASGCVSCYPKCEIEGDDLLVLEEQQVRAAVQHAVPVVYRTDVIVGWKRCLGAEAWARSPFNVERPALDRRQSA